jgi:hypothetical protein
MLHYWKASQIVDMRSIGFDVLIPKGVQFKKNSLTDINNMRYTNYLNLLNSVNDH